MALALASNSTGRVTMAKKATTAYKATPNQARVRPKPLIPRKDSSKIPPMISPADRFFFKDVMFRI